MHLVLPLLFLGQVLLARPPALASDNEAFAAEHGSFFHLLRSERSDVQLGYLLERDQESETGGTKFDLDIFYGRFELPFALNSDFYLRYGFDYEARQYDLLETPASLSLRQRHHCSPGSW